MTRLIAAISLVLLLGGCATANKACHMAINEYEAEKCDAALADFQKVASQQADMNARWRLRYLVFRGLTHFHLWQEKGSQDDLLAARQYLEKGKSNYEHGSRDYLSVAEERELDEALATATAAERKSGEKARPGAR